MTFTTTAGSASSSESRWRAQRILAEDKIMETSRRFAANETHTKIKFHLARGMSRGALERIYGKQVVRDVVEPTAVNGEQKVDSQ